MALRMAGLMRARNAAKMHHEQTNANCTTVRVTGLGSAVKIAFDEALDRMEVAYQRPQRAWEC